MKINNICLQNFRNYKNLELNFNSSRNIIVGENAQGKTNLIEAIYMCSFAKSFRTSNAADMISFNSDYASINADIESEDIEKNLDIKINKSGKKMIKKDGKLLSRTADLLNNLVVIVFSPDDLRIIKDAPDRRRNFINKELSQLRPKYYDNLKRYNAALNQKNSLLKSPNIDEMLLDAYDSEIAKCGFQIMNNRRDFVKQLSAQAAKIQSSISAGNEILNIKLDESISANREGEFYDELLNHRDRDIYFNHSSIGPHRDDLIFEINGKDAKKYASQGQQRTIALSLKLAEIKIAAELLDENPILLLDDVLSELDTERQSFLINQIDDVQLFITSTELHPFIIDKMSDASLYRVESGSIVKIKNY